MSARLRSAGPSALILPGFLLVAGLFIWPVAQLVATSFGDRAGALVHYAKIFTEPTYLRVVGRTLLLSAQTALLCVLLGYPLAYQLTRAGRLGKALILVCILIPFWTNLLVRTYGWIILLNPQGVINGLLRQIGLLEGSLPLVYNTTGVLIGMTQIMLPYMVLPLAAVMSRLDPAVLRAARSLGASPYKAFLKVYVPLTLPGVLGGFLLVFMLSLGFFVVPAILGGPRDLLLAQLIEFNINQTLNWPFAAALSTVLLAATVTLYWLGDRFFGLGRLWGRAMTKGLGNGILSASAGLLCLFLIMPTLIVAPISFTQTDFITFPPRGFSTRWYEAFFERPEWYGSLVTSTLVAVVTTLLATLLGSMIALGLVRLSRRANRLVSFFFLLPMIVPTIITATALYSPFAKLGLIATVPGLVLAHTILALPFVVINVSAVAQSMDWRMVNAARSLGASPLVAFRRVTLPVLAPGIAAGAIFAFLTSFDEVVVALFLSGSSATTLPVQMWSGIRFEISPIVAAASCLLLVVSCLLLALFWFLKRK